MRVETLELLRCPAPHEPSPLITVAYERDGDRIVEGSLGCSICGAEYALREGVVYLSVDAPIAPDAEAKDPMRTAALLGLNKPGVRVALCGAFGRHAVMIEEATDARCIAINTSSIAVDPIRCTALDIVPLATASLHGLAIDDTHMRLLGDAARVVQAGGRVLGPAHAPIPDGCRELARDEYEWVAVVERTSSAPVTLQLSRSTSS